MTRPSSRSLLVLLFSTAGAFSPPTSRQPLKPTIGCTPGGGVPSHPFSYSRRDGPNDNHIPSPFNRFSGDGTNGLRLASSLAMKSIAAEQRPAYKKRIATFMAFLTGWADTLFIRKYNFFGTMMTGNSMKLGWALVDGRVRDAAFFLTVISSYILGVGMYRRGELSFKDKALNGLFAPIVAACFVCSDYCTFINASKFLPGLMLAFSWGIINSVGSEVTGTLVFVVTGAMTRLSNMIVNRISNTAGRNEIPKEGFLMSLSVIGGFILGAMWCAVLSKLSPSLEARGAFSILGGIYAMFFLWLDQDQLGAWWSKEDGGPCEIDAEEVDCN